MHIYSSERTNKLSNDCRFRKIITLTQAQSDS